MTAQVGDRFQFKGEDYSIVAMSTPIGFKPQDYGITPEPVCTACWDGYWCEYEITKAGIILKNLYINSKNDHYPEINGISPQNDRQKKSRFQYMGHHLYKDLDIRMDYTGRILIGKDFIQKYYIHMGYQRAWAYETLEELVFQDGALIETVRHSEMARRLREKVDIEINDKQETNVDVRKFVEECFSLKMEDKAWWIE